MRGHQQMGRAVPHCRTGHQREDSKDSTGAQEKGQGAHPGGGEHWSKPPSKRVSSLRGRAFQVEGLAYVKAGSQLLLKAVGPFHSWKEN